MKTMFQKELKLTASILSYVFVAFALMTVIPQYPILVGAFFICFGIFHSFQRAREANDILYSTLLPVKKTDIVKSKYLFAVFIQAVGFAAIVALTLLRMLLLNKIEPYASGSMMNANLAYLGYVLLIFAWFNTLFIGGFFKTAYKIGIPFLKFAVTTLATVVVGESLHFFPGLDVLNANFHWSHLIILFVGVATYVIGTFLSLKKSQTRFENIDL